MSITRTGVKLSKNGTWGDSDDLDFYVDEGGLGTWNFQATGLEAATQYNVKGYIVQDGSTIESAVDNFTTESLPVDYLTFSNPNDSATTLNLSRSGSPDEITIETSTDGGATWATWDSTGITSGSFSIPANGTLRMRGNNSHFGKSTSAYWKFSSSSNVYASGSLMALLDSTGQSTTISDDYCFYRLFNNMSTLLSAPSLPATTLSPYCYMEMFSWCEGLTSAPELPATSLTDYCYYGMFSGCTGLTTAPELPATTLASNCYQQMFLSCTGLTSAPELPATILADNCYYQMFRSCTGLTSAPELPATTLANLCYDSMFYGCSNISRVIIYITTWITNNTGNWLRGVSSTGDFYNLGGATISSGDSGIPSGWTEHTSL